MRDVKHIPSFIKILEDDGRVLFKCPIVNCTGGFWTTINIHADQVLIYCPTCDYQFIWRPKDAEENTINVRCEKVTHI